MDNLLRSKLSKPLNYRKRLDIIDQFRQLVFSLTDPISVYLVGSILSTNFDQFSDLDTVIVFKTPLEAKLALKKLNRARKALPRSVDWICIDEDSFKYRSRTGGICYVAAQEGFLLLKPKTCDLHKKNA